ncbi:MAG: hypothetical protein HOP28_15455 [Gemmatimonadales bacterium]|nr:hypothetical protein [Gemmatimonadales bacterium]
MPPTPAPDQVAPYNFARPPRISKDRHAILMAIHSRFAGAVQSFLSSRLRQAADVSITSIEQETFGEFVQSRGDPCAAFVFDLGEQVGVEVVVDLDTTFAFYLVDRLFGGPGEADAVIRPVTNLEQMLLRGMVDRIMGLLREAWGEQLPIAPACIGFEGTPGTLRVANRDDNVLVTVVKLSAGRCTGSLAICLPLIALESFLQEKSGTILAGPKQRNEEGRATRSAVERCVRQVSLPVASRLKSFTLPAASLAALRPGHLLLTWHDVDSEIDLYVNGDVRFTGRIGQQRGHFGIRITKSCEGKSPRLPKGRRLA